MLCDDCRNEMVCKFSEELKDTYKDLNSNPINSPISVEVKCSKYLKNTNTREGIMT